MFNQFSTISTIINPVNPIKHLFFPVLAQMLVAAEQGLIVVGVDHACTTLEVLEKNVQGGRGSRAHRMPSSDRYSRG